MNTDTNSWPQVISNPSIDARLYTDRRPPADMNDESVACDYMMRVCSAYDNRQPPSDEVVNTLRQMRYIFDTYPLSCSYAYHALRRMFGWPELPFIGQHYSFADHLDELEGREPDPILI